MSSSRAKSTTDTSRSRSAWFERPSPLGSYLAFAMMSCTVVMFAVAVLAPQLQRDLGLATLDFGLFTTVFFITGALASPLVGRFVDAVGPRQSLYLLFGLTSGSLGVLIFAPSRPAFLLSAVVGGIATSMGNPTTNSILARHLEGKALASAVGVKQAGVPASSFVAGALLPPLALVVTWRGSVAVIVVLCVAGAIIAARLPRERADADETARRSSRPKGVARPKGGGLGQYRAQVLLISGYIFLIGGGLAGIQTYLVLYGVFGLGYTEAVAGFAAAVLGVAGVISRVVAPRLILRLGGAYRGLWLAGFGSVLSTLVLVFSVRFPALLFISAFGLGLTAVAANAVANYVLVSELPRTLAGRASGTVQTGFYGGMSISPLFFGWLIERIGYGPAWWVAVGAFIAALVLATFASSHARTREGLT